MSDETTLLPCPFCGGEANVIDHHNDDGSVSVGCDNDTCLGFSGLGWLYKTEAEAIAAWNTRAHGMMTAEQVREAIMSADRWEKPMGNTGLTNTHLIIRDDGWQAIADELNAELGSGTCENSAKEWGEKIYYFVCSECGWNLANVGRASIELAAEMIKTCPNCGRQVKR